MLGILFVHGIGEQRRGQTLTEMGEPLVDWLRRWVTGPGEIADPSEPTARDSPVEIDDARIVPLETGDASMVVARVSVGQQTQKWLLAESWWAEVFLPAKFSQLASWGLLVGPVVLASHVSLIVQRLLATTEATSRRLEESPSWSKLGNVPIGAVWVFGGLTALIVAVLAAIVAFVFEVAAILLLLAAILPLPWIRGFVVSLQRGLANGLGDSYVLSQSPFQYTAMVGRVIRDVQWLADRAEHVIVIAHSQGAAVAYEALRNPLDRPRRVRMLITFGQGLRKLRALAALGRTTILTWSGRGFWFVFILSSAGLLLLGFSAIVIGCRALHCGGEPLAEGTSVWEALAGQLWSGWGLIGLLAFLIVIFSQLWIMERAQAGEERLEDALSKEFAGIGLEHGEFEWLDLYASADPVPNGPLIGRGREVDGFRSLRVRNLGSTVSDHTTYWRNHLDFVTKVAVTIGDITGLGLDVLRPGDQERLEAGRALRARRVTLLTGYRIIAVIGWLAILASIGRRLPVIGRAIVEPLPDQLPVVGEVSQLPSPVLGTIAAALIGLVVYLWYLLARSIWAWGMASDDRRFFSREDAAKYWTSTPHALSALLMAVGLGAVSAAVAGLTLEPLYVAALLGIIAAAWLVTTVFPRVADEEGMAAFTPYTGAEVAVPDTPGT